jgi:hypothetical protein
VCVYIHVCVGCAPIPWTNFNWMWHSMSHNHPKYCQNCKFLFVFSEPLQLPQIDTGTLFYSVLGAGVVMVLRLYPTGVGI